MSQQIVFSGVAYGISFIELSDEELEALTLELEEADDVQDVSRVSELVDESFYEYGLLPPDEEDLKLKVDDVDLSELVDKLVAKGMENAYKVDLSPKNHMLVHEARESIDFICKAESFDPEKLTVEVKQITLPNGVVKTLLTPSFIDAGFDPGESTSGGRIYIVKNDGEEIDF